jgi:tRNA (mo5U34)-methyltransferase
VETYDGVVSDTFWWHSIDLGSGEVTPGHKSTQTLDAELSNLDLPDLDGKTVLDIGAWDGYFSFAAERLGAKRVVALDHYVWMMDLPRQQAYFRSCIERGVEPAQYESVEGLWQPDTLPGKRAFDIARAALGSSVESVVGDFMTMDLETLGQFDVVLFLGVLYHLRDPWRALERLRHVTRETARIETHAVAISGHPRLRAWEFYPGAELAADSSNWWGPTLEGLLSACRDVGFSAAAITDVPEPAVGVENYRLVVRCDYRAGASLARLEPT